MYQFLTYFARGVLSICDEIAIISAASKSSDLCQYHNARLIRSFASAIGQFGLTVSSAIW